MPKPTTLELATLKSHPVFVQRYVSTCPRVAIFACRVNGVATVDATTLGQIAIPFDTVATGAYTDVKVGMTLDIGTTLGGREVGSVRIRKAATSNTLYINATASADVPIVDNLFLTVRDEYLIWPKRWRLVATKTGSSKYVNSFTQYKDYEEAYSDQGSKPPPKVNIVASVTAEGDYLPVAFAGFVDAGQTYRTVTLKAVGVAIAKSATIASYLWDVDDGTITVGSTSTQQITVRFPASKTWRHVRCTATDSNSKTGWMVAPIAVHDADHPPFTALSVERVEAAEGHEAAVTLFGLAGDADETVIPRQTTTILWTRARFAGSAAPAVYIAQRLMWATRETSTPKADEPTWSLELAGAAFWLRGIGGPADMITYKASSLGWSNMTSITIDRLAAHVLQNYSTFMNVCNFHPTGSDDETKERAINEGSLWEQVQAIAKLGAANPWCTADSGLVLRPQQSYMTDDDYDALSPYLTLTAADWPLDATPALVIERTEQVGLTECGGSSWDGTKERLYLARAPGKTPGRSSGRQDETFILPAPVGLQSDLARLLELAGHHWAKLNNPRPDNSLELLHAIDCVEPGEVIRLQATNALTGEALDELFVVTRVSSAHSVEAGQPMIRVTYGLEQVTRGEPGEPQEIATSSTPGIGISNGSSRYYPNLYTPSTPPWQNAALYSGTQRIALICQNGLALTTNFGSGDSTYWVFITWASLSVSGTVLVWVPHGSDPGSGWVVTSTNVYYLTLGANTVVDMHTFAVSSILRAADASFGAGALNHFAVSSLYATGGVKCLYTGDNVTFSEALVDSNYATDISTSGLVPACYVSSHQAGVVITSAFTSTTDKASIASTGRISTTYGATWATLDADFLCGFGLAQQIHGPWNDNASDDLLFHGAIIAPESGVGSQRLYRFSGGSQVDISPVIGGSKFGPRKGRDQIATYVGNKNRLLAALQTAGGGSNYGIFLTDNPLAATPAWTLLFPPTADYTACAIAGNSGATFYMWGDNQAIAVSDDSGLTIRSQTGNLGSYSTGTILSIAGY